MKDPLNNLRRVLLWAGCGFMLVATASAQTEGTVALNATITDYVGRSGDDHYTAVWITTASGTFIRTLWEQGPSLGNGEWRDHCRKFWDAKNGENTVDGFSGATARNYDPPTNNPIDPTWDCRDRNNNLVADGDYKFWIQYAENSGQGPYTTNGLLWTKGPTPSNLTYRNQGTNFINMSATWTPVTSPPTITSAPPASTGIVGAAYGPYTCTASGTTPITFSAPGLPTGLSISPSGVISGTPTVAGVFSGTITASNGTAPDATQGFSITISELVITSVERSASTVVLSGIGPANGSYSVLASVDPSRPVASWATLHNGTFSAAGVFSSVSLPLAPAISEIYLRLRVP